MLSDTAFAATNRRQKWTTISTSYLQLSTDFIQLYLQSIYSTQFTILLSLGNAKKKPIALLLSHVCDLL